MKMMRTLKNVVHLVHWKQLANETPYNKQFKKEYGRPHCAHLELAKGAMAARAAVARLTVSKHDYHFIN